MTETTFFICGGVNAPENTQQMIANMVQYPAFNLPTRQVQLAISPLEIFSIPRLWSAMECPAGPAIFLAFSAGCIAAVGAARHWHHHGGQVLGLFAVDGWGVPLMESFPVHRLSHDRFTHLTSTLPGLGTHFYADPAVAHLKIWQVPSQVHGLSTPHGETTTAARFLADWIEHYLQTAA